VSDPHLPSRSRLSAGEAVPAPPGDPDFMLSLARGLATIRAFGGGGSQLSVADVARLTALSRASARRCLHTLTVLGYAAVAGGRYELTPAILTLGQAYLSSMRVARVAQPVLERVSEELHESSSVAVLDGDEIVYVARAAARRILAISLAVGSRLPAACTSMGRVLLAAADPDDRARFLRRVKLPRYTARTITDRQALAAELDAVRVQGYAVVDQELELGLRSCAVPIARRDGTVVAALNVGAHAARADASSLTRDVVPLLKRAAQEIGAALDTPREPGDPACRIV
jgi:IclR family transcriptional regulator, pca regulon regulatory protein